ncbi:MAG: polyprenyl synthetase family protein [Candidatus Odinarchaeota archaeon]|nr:polyprenyl synthetase family protein [Candidatus Odinarchaeota archaeon]
MSSIASDAYLSQLRSKIDNALKELILENFHEESISEVVAYVLNDSGKRIRPLFTLLISDLIGIPPETNLKSSLIVELVHNASLFHDDVIDKDSFRRGKPSAFTVFGMGASILTGDILFALAYKIATELGKKYAESLVELVTKALRGSFIQTINRHKIISREDYLQIAYLKTGSFFEHATTFATLAYSKPFKYSEEIVKLGANIGIAYQLRDDFIGLYSPVNKAKKPIGIDLINGDPNIFVVLAFEKSLSKQDREYLENVYVRGHIETFDIERIRKIFNQNKILDMVVSLVNKYVEDAKSSLNKFSDSKSKQVLIDLIDKIRIHPNL